MSLLNPIGAIGANPTRLPESTGVLGYQANPFVATSIWSSTGGGTETTGVNSFSGSSSSSSSSGGGASINFSA